VLGYPECCVVADSEVGVRLTVLAVEGFRRKYGAATAADLIQCAERGVEVELELPLHAGLQVSTRRFPFVQFAACLACLADPTGPAAGINAAMRRVAEAVDPEFARAIERAAAAEVAALDCGRPGPTRPVGGDALPRPPLRRVGPNEPCPCGSGRKYKSATAFRRDRRLSLRERSAPFRQERMCGSQTPYRPHPFAERKATIRRNQSPPLETRDGSPRR
jgi:hypothetical protein